MASKICTLFMLTIWYSTSILSTLSAQDTLRVFVLAGQSNMEGHGQIYDASTNGTLEHFANQGDPDFDFLTDINGDFAEPSDVWISFKHEWDGLKTGNLNVGFGGNETTIGPEYAFGLIMSEHFNDQVLLIKTAWGGRSLAVDFRPPSSDGDTGDHYNFIVSDVNEALSNLASTFPEYQGAPYQIEGFAWHQGWNDGETIEYLMEYESNMINFINDMRSDLNAPNLPFVIANTGIGGFELSSDGWTHDLQTYLVPAQGNAVNNFGATQKVALADTRPFWREADESPADALHHWNENAWTYFMIGYELAQQMTELLLEQTISNVEQLERSPIQVFPNPAHQYLQLKNVQNTDAIVILNALGQEIYAVSEAFDRIDISNLTPGLYFVAVKVESGKLSQLSKFVKQ